MKFLFPILVLSLSLSVPAFAKKRTPSRKPSNVSSESSSGLERSALQKILSIEDSRIDKDRFLPVALKYSSRRVVKAALLALARIQDPAPVEAVSNFLNSRDREYRVLAAFTLGAIGGELPYRLLTQHIQMHKDPEVNAAILQAIGRIGREQSQPIFEKALKTETNTSVLEAAAKGTGYLFSQAEEKWTYSPELMKRLIQLTGARFPIGFSATFALARYRGPANLLTVEDLITTVSQTNDQSTRTLLYRVIGKVKNQRVANWLASQLLEEPSTACKVEIVKGFKSQPPTPEISMAYRAALTFGTPRVVHEALESLSAIGSAPSMTDVVVKLVAPPSSLWIERRALATLAKINPEEARKLLPGILKNPKGPLYGAAIQALASMGTAADIETLTPLVATLDTKTQVQLLDSLSTLPANVFTSALQESVRKLIERADTGLTSIGADLAAKNEWKDFYPTLVSVYPRLSKDAVEAKVSIVTALGKLGDSSTVPFLEKALEDTEKVVVSGAAESLKTLTGKDYSARIPLNSTVTGPTPLLEDVQAAIGRRVVLKTVRGDIVLKTLSSAPVTALRFLQLVKSGFYKGKIFHRVVPNFVVQGGDPRGDGYGGPGFLIRDEISPTPHDRGTVGVATAGKDTGGSQFFINLEPNPHLNARYTAFAQVVSGLEVADQIEAEDTILSATLQ